MPDRWCTVALAEVFEPCSERLGAHETEPPVFALSKYEGIILASEYFGKRIASDHLDGYKVVRPGEWAYSTIHIDEGSIARNNLSAIGVLSPMYTTMRWIAPDHDPRYFELLLRSPQLIDEYKSRARGTVNRRRSLAYPAFAAIEVEVPPRAQQRRIVDVVRALDDAAGATRVLAERLRRLLDAVVEREVLRQDFNWVPLTDIAAEGGIAGGPFGSNLTTRDFVPTGVPVIQGSNLTDGRPYLRGRFKYVSDAKAATLPRNMAQPGDVIVTQRGTLGQVALVPKDGPSTYVISQSQMRLRVRLDRAIPEYVYLVLASPRLVAEVLSQKVATANPHINLGIFSRLTVPLPPHAVQSRIVNLATAVMDQEDAAARTLHSFKRVRSSLLADLLRGEREIPASYDRFFDDRAS